MKTVTIPIFEYDELSKEAQEKVINETIQFMIETIDPETDECSLEFIRASKEARELQTPWFLAEYVWDYCKEEVLGYCREFFYFKNGSVYQEEAY